MKPDQHKRDADEGRNQQGDRKQKEYPIERARALRRELAVVAGDLASTELAVADIQERLAAQHPDDAAKYQDVAKKAREVARRASEIAKHFAN